MFDLNRIHDDIYEIVGALGLPLPEQGKGLHDIIQEMIIPEVTRTKQLVFDMADLLSKKET